MTRTVSVIVFTIGMVLAWGFPVTLVTAEPVFVWGTAELIETDAGNAQAAQVAADPQGNVTAVWAQFAGSRRDIWANRFVPGVGWGTAELIETDDVGDATLPLVAVDSQGNAVAMWEQHPGTFRFNIRANRFVPGVGWGTAELISGPGNAFSPQVAVDSQGTAVAVWYQFDGTRFNIWANRFVETEPGVLVSPEVVTFGVVGAIAAAAAGVALLLWRRRARGKEKA